MFCLNRITAINSMFVLCVFHAALCLHSVHSSRPWAPSQRFLISCADNERAAMIFCKVVSYSVILAKPHCMHSFPCGLSSIQVFSFTVVKRKLC